MSKKQLGLRVIPELSTERVPFPWDITMPLLEQPSYIPLIPQVRLKLATQYQISKLDFDWAIALHWVVKKKWNPQLKFPVPRKLADLYEPWGELMFRQLELCIRCHEASQPTRQFYRNPSDWYLQLIIETKGDDVCDIIANKAIGKKPFIKDKYSIIKELKEYRNPANPETWPHFHRLMKAALALQKQDSFYKDYWRPYLKACSQWIQKVDSKTYTQSFVKGNKIFQRLGKGKVTRMILGFPEPIPRKVFLKSDSLDISSPR
jgi:hypothetical protein